jgi:hypothetical protein
VLLAGGGALALSVLAGAELPASGACPLGSPAVASSSEARRFGGTAFADGSFFLHHTSRHVDAPGARQLREKPYSAIAFLQCSRFL